MFIYAHFISIQKEWLKKEVIFLFFIKNIKNSKIITILMGSFRPATLKERKYFYEKEFNQKQCLFFFWYA